MKVILNSNELNNELEKIYMYKTEESIFFDKIISSLNQMTNLYVTNNSDSLNNLNFEMVEKLKIVNNIHNNYITVINKNLVKYEEVSKKVENILSDIDTMR